MLPQNRRPTTPGEVLQEEFLNELNLTQGDFAKAIGVRTETINRLVNGSRAVSTNMALRLSAALGTTPEFWINLQSACDLWDETQKHADELAKIARVC